MKKLMLGCFVLQIWCGTHRPEHAVNSIKTDVHSPGKFRYDHLHCLSARFRLGLSSGQALDSGQLFDLGQVLIN